MPNHVKIIRNTFAALLFAGAASQTAYAFHPVIYPGMFMLTAAPNQAGTCTQDQMLPPFSYLLYGGPGNAVSTFYYYGAPGAKVDLVTVPKGANHLRWNGDMTWALNPLTFMPPSITTSFNLDFTPLDSHAILINGRITVPTSTGGTCTEIVSYTGMRAAGP